MEWGDGVERRDEDKASSATSSDACEKKDTGHSLPPQYTDEELRDRATASFEKILREIEGTLLQEKGAVLSI